MEAKARKPKKVAKANSRPGGKKQVEPLGRDELQNKAVCKALFQFQRDLNIKTKDLAEILAVDTRTLSRWQEAEQIANFSDKRVREPIANFLGIVATLTEMFSHSDGREAWLKTPHPQLQKAPLALISESLEQLINVRQYLDYVSSRGA